MTTYSSAIDVIDQLNETKNELVNRLEDVKVVVNQNTHPDIIAAISGLFGSEYIKDGVATITFPMIMECINTVNAAGKAKAKELMV